MKDISALAEELEEAWAELQRVHLALPSNLADGTEETAARLFAVETALRRYYDLLRSIEKERKRLKDES